MTRLTWMADAFRANDLRVREVQGWKDRGRPGTFEPRGVIFHHTASGRHSGVAPSLRTCTNGRPGINGPLCNVMIGRDSTVFVVAAGRSNHAGRGGPFRNIPANSANAFMAGVEVENDGSGERWTPALLTTADIVFATLLIGLRRSPAWLIGHKEWAPGRKIDPHPLSMDDRRRQVARQIQRLTGERPPHSVRPTIHVVRRGDTLFAIARAHGLSVQDLKRLNGLNGDLIRVDQRLIVKA
jgi:hypothetical protein